MNDYVNMNVKEKRLHRAERHSRSFVQTCVKTLKTPVQSICFLFSVWVIVRLTHMKSWSSSMSHEAGRKWYRMIARMNECVGQSKCVKHYINIVILYWWIIVQTIWLNEYVNVNVNEEWLFRAGRSSLRSFNECMKRVQHMNQYSYFILT